MNESQPKTEPMPSLGSRVLHSVAVAAFLGVLCACASDDTISNRGHGPEADAGGSSANDGDATDTIDLGNPGSDTPTDNRAIPTPPNVDWLDDGGTKTHIDDTVADADPAQFDGSRSTNGSASVVYPLDGSMHAPNEPQLTIQWRKGADSQELFAIELKNAQASYRFISPCRKDDERPDGEATKLADNECAYKLPEQYLLNLGLSNAGESFELRVLASESGNVKESAAATIHFAPEVIRGAFYYWSTKSLGVYRAPFGARKARSYIAPETPENPFACAGCHSVSRDGSTVAFVTGNGYPGGLQVAPSNDPSSPIVESVPHPTERYQEGTDSVGGTPQPSEPHYAQSIALSPDGRWVVAYQYNHVKVIEVATSRVTQKLSVGDEAFTLPEHVGKDPEFSPDGSKVALSLTSVLYQNGHTWESSIGVMPFDAENGELGKAEVIVNQNGTGAAAPSWSPDGKWLAFHQMPDTDLYGGQLNAARREARRDATLFMTPSSGGPYTCPDDPQCSALNKAQQGAQTSPGFVKFSPFDMDEGSLLFFTFNTLIDYGVIQSDSLNPQLWLAAVDTSKLSEGDASYAPTWIPLQSIEENNHFGFWTEKLICESSSECGACEDCIDNACVPQVSCIR